MLFIEFLTKKGDVMHTFKVHYRKIFALTFIILTMFIVVVDQSVFGALGGCNIYWNCFGMGEFGLCTGGNWVCSGGSTCNAGSCRCGHIVCGCSGGTCYCN